MKTALTVVVDDKGDVVATHAPARHLVKGGIQVQSGLGTLPGQTMHKIEFEVPDAFRNQKEVDEFHRAVRNHIAQEQHPISRDSNKI